MKGLRFDWNAEKAAKNWRKHRVTFEEAESVWLDRRRIEIFDADHSSDDESRSVAIGFSGRMRMLIVVFTERYEVIRLISARCANRSETERYFAAS